MKNKYSGKRGRVDCDDNQRDRGDQEERESAPTAQCKIFLHFNQFHQSINIRFFFISVNFTNPSINQCKIFSYIWCHLSIFIVSETCYNYYFQIPLLGQWSGTKGGAGYIRCQSGPDYKLISDHAIQYNHTTTRKLIIYKHKHYDFLSLL